MYFCSLILLVCDIVLISSFNTAFSVWFFIRSCCRYMYFILLRLLMYISINMAKDIVNNMQMINTALSFW